MTHYSQYRALTLSLDDWAAKLESLPTAYDNDEFELAKSVELARCREGINLLLSSTNVTKGHQCPGAASRLTTEHDPEFKNCRCQDRPADQLQDPNLLPF